MELIKYLKELEKDVYTLVSPSNRYNWSSLDITYEEPHVERLSISIKPNWKLCIHLIHHSNKTPLYHPHEWISAVKIIKGRYLMIVGSEKRILTTLELKEGSYYEMNTEEGFHSVNPITNTSLSIMLIGNKYSNPIDFPKPKEKQKELSEERKKYLFEQIMDEYDLWY